CVQLVDLASRHRGGQADDPCRRRRADDLARRLRSVEAGHAVVDEQHVGLELPAELDRLVPACGRADHGQVAPEAEQELERLAEDGVVLGDHDADLWDHRLGLYSAERSRAYAAWPPSCTSTSTSGWCAATAASRPSSGGEPAPVRSVSTSRGP